MLGSVAKLHALHRSFYMNERIQYYSRKEKAISQPKEYMSMIIDGMTQQHCLLPWLTDKIHFNKCVPQHLAGVINHGRHFSVYRTFHNVKNNSNLICHIIINELFKC